MLKWVFAAEGLWLGFFLSRQLTAQQEFYAAMAALVLAFVLMLLWDSRND